MLTFYFHKIKYLNIFNNNIYNTNNNIFSNNTFNHNKNKNIYSINNNNI
jgi:hypothetical protein